MGDAGFDTAMEQELCVFFLTDFKLRQFQRIIKGMGFRDQPQLRDI